MGTITVHVHYVVGAGIGLVAVLLRERAATTQWVPSVTRIHHLYQPITMDWRRAVLGSALQHHVRAITWASLYFLMASPSCRGTGTSVLAEGGGSVKEAYEMASWDWGGWTPFQRWDQLADLFLKGKIHS